MRWREFETLVREVQQQTAPSAVVRHNYRMKGRSGRLRQLDITLSQNVGLHSVLIVIECKHYGRPVGVDRVEAFVTKLSDVGASQGVMISSGRFSSGAKAVATQHFIRLFTYRQAMDFDWKAIVGEHAWIKFMLIKIEGLKAKGVTGDGTKSDLPLDSILIDANDKELSLKEVFSQVRRISHDSLEPGPFEVELGLEPGARTLQAHKHHPVTTIAFEGYMKLREYIINLELAGGHVLQNAVGSELIFQQVVTRGFDWAEVLRSQTGRDVTPDEWQATKESPGFLRTDIDLSKLKRYLRLVITKKFSN